LFVLTLELSVFGHAGSEQILSTEQEIASFQDASQSPAARNDTN